MSHLLHATQLIVLITDAFSDTISHQQSTKVLVLVVATGPCSTRETRPPENFTPFQCQHPRVESRVRSSACVPQLIRPENTAKLQWSEQSRPHHLPLETLHYHLSSIIFLNLVAILTSSAPPVNDISDPDSVNFVTRIIPFYAQCLIEVSYLLSFAVIVRDETDLLVCRIRETES